MRPGYLEKSGPNPSGVAAYPLLAASGTTVQPPRTLPVAVTLALTTPRRVHGRPKMCIREVRIADGRVAGRCPRSYANACLATATWSAGLEAALAARVHPPRPRPVRIRLYLFGTLCPLV